MSDTKSELDLLSVIGLWLLMSTGAQAGRPSLRVQTRIITSGLLERTDSTKAIPNA
jgi:hypothetical protein